MRIGLEGGRGMNLEGGRGISVEGVRGEAFARPTWDSRLCVSPGRVGPPRFWASWLRLPTFTQKYFVASSSVSAALSVCAGVR